MSSENNNADELNQRINRRLLPLKRLFIHLVITIVVVAGLSLAAERMNVPDFVDGIIPIVVLLFIAHALWVTFFEAQRYLVQQETVAYQAGLPEKPKHSEHVDLSDDGELVEFLEEGSELRKMGSD